MTPLSCRPKGSMSSGRQCALLRGAAALALPFLLAACAQTSAPAPDLEWDSRSISIIEDRIADSARRSTNALETLAMIERARTEPISSGVSESLRDLPEELLRSTTLEWSGPAVQLTRRLSESIGYSFLEQGAAPAVPVMVHVSVEDMPVIKAFEQIGMHLQPVAAIVVDPNVKRVEFVHGPVSAPDWIAE